VPAAVVDQRLVIQVLVELGREEDRRPGFVVAQVEAVLEPEELAQMGGELVEQLGAAQRFTHGT
jgi:hypothetical protein